MMARQGYDRQSAAAIIHHVQGVGSHAEAAGGYRAARAQKRSPREAARFRRAEWTRWRRRLSCAHLS